MNDTRAAFRKTKAWKDFRQHMFEIQSIDPITNRKLLKGANLHHRCLDSNQYQILEEDRFVLLNRQSHKLLHIVYGDERRKKDWRKILDNLRIQCEEMDKYNTSA
jgi:hypothetical protein